MTDDAAGLRVRQYVYFALKSESVPVTAMIARLGAEPDRRSVRGARRAEPPLPVCHLWIVECRTPGLRLDEQISRVLDRVRPLAGELRGLVATGEVRAVLQAVRYHDADDGEPETHEPVTTGDGRVLEAMAGQHQLLGWHLAAADLAFLASVPADLDVDEYS
ncbi:DUF4279 domain-containing protein [Kineosporia sp. J2-2]|uniref:DUF4279 domain-containing protein n=1 Tax=Kineosporia corallincola TaxID=2835133 RepID=A0ABS5TKE7_9ACTN|nr:DUF4279 domain-containing protein [Kineosporia corallincola]MBT0771490.1 DUF4279 domain-containing protein [Kineosporia corallincola]